MYAFEHILQKSYLKF